MTSTFCKIYNKTLDKSSVLWYNSLRKCESAHFLLGCSWKTAYLKSDRLELFYTPLPEALSSGLQKEKQKALHCKDTLGLEAYSHEGKKQ